MEKVKGFFDDSLGTWEVELTLIEPAPKPIPRRRHVTKREKMMLLIRQDYRCALCRGPVSLLDAHVDHVYPLALGGEDVESNRTLTHAWCNLRKGKRLVVGQGSMPWAA